jgi:hypothetical protein
MVKDRKLGQSNSFSKAVPCANAFKQNFIELLLAVATNKVMINQLY